VGAVGNEEPPRDLHPLGPEAVHLLEEGLGIENDAVAHHAAGAGVQDATGHLLEDELLVPHHHGMAGVGPALVADHHVRLLGQDVHQLAFALVAPLGADDHDARAVGAEHSVPRRSNKKGPGGPYGSPRKR
jgi:hypothetical protein